MEVFTALFNYITDKSRSLGARSLVILTIFASIFLIDYLLGFSFYFSTSKKIDILNNIEKLKSSYKLDSITFNEVNGIEQDLIRKKSFYTYFNFFRQDKKPKIPAYSINLQKRADSLAHIIIINKYKNEKESKHQNFYNKLNINKTQEVERSNVIHILTSSYGLILFLLIIPFVLIFSKNEKDAIIGLIFFFFLLIPAIWFNSYLMSLIPIIYKPIINYILNVVIHGCTILLIYGLVKTFSKK